MQLGTIAILAALGILPPLLFLLWMRNREHVNREPFGVLLQMFLFGATVGVLVAFVLNTAFGTAAGLFLTGPATTALLVAVVSAPLVEESVKALGFRLSSVRRECDELEDGIIYGAAVGLGFAASENMFYGFVTLEEAAQADAIMVVVLRIFSSMVLHAGASAVLGYAIGRRLRMGTSAWGVVPYFVTAVLMHSVYNLVVTVVPIAGFVLALVLVWVVIAMMRRTISRMEAVEHPGLVPP